MKTSLWNRTRLMYALGIAGIGVWAYLAFVKGAE